MNDFNSREFRDVLGSFATGVTIVTSNYQDAPVGMTINSFSSVSLEPPLVLWCLSKDANSYDIFSSTKFYNIQILSETQKELSKKFANPDSDKFDGVSWHSDNREVPYIEGCKATLHCEQETLHEGGDHIIVVGRVIEISEMTEEKPLIFAQGKYAELKV